MKLFWLTALAMIAFAANSVLTRMALSDGADPFAFTAIRVFSGAVVLMSLVVFRGGLPKVSWRNYAGSSLTLLAYMLGFSISYLSVSSGIGALILFATVQISMTVGAIVSRDPMPAQRWIGGALALAGLVYLLWPSGEIALTGLGAFAMIVAGIGWGMYSLIGRSAENPLADTAVNFAIATVPTVLVWAVLQGEISATGAGLAVISGGLTSGLGYALWYAILQHLGASRAGVAQLTVPLFASIGGYVILGEQITPKFKIASLLVLGGIALSMVGGPKKR
ncbi:threonine/homoserine efflux transporter RhtA [Pacificibacter maritimus]|uniref:Threonine/homoserine efflux transporter RhtA n=1 Tax=Pacificibacter maritimus TaxID=762213 RepID=A0A3N4UGP2_9RHOB|nr:DMT family transporter [Pacificibacter maritimus]RPE66411.1 threonine/homoserine efflux transporter RhtA [Pacificibacter maritimus]